MNKKVLVISASLRPGSNSHALAEQFAEGAREAGHEVELVACAARRFSSAGAAPPARKPAAA